MWYTFRHSDEVATPALAVYPDRIQQNIDTMIHIAVFVDRLCPHVKTHKLSQVTRMLVDSGIRQFKCATTAELAMVADSGARFALLAYQPVGPHLRELAALAASHRDVEIGAVVDNARSAEMLNEMAERYGIHVSTFVDIDAGMARTGIPPGDGAAALYASIAALPHLRVGGLHAYDGHIHDTDVESRRQRVEQGIAPVLQLRQQLIDAGLAVPRLICGGTPSFPIHAAHPDRICSPGTPVFWDAGYAGKFPDLPFQPAAVLLTRVVSKLTDHRVCLDLGYKAIAAEMPHPRAEFLNLPPVQEVGHSEEHLVIEGDLASLQVGDLVFALPRHVCPTVALYDRVIVVREGAWSDSWSTTARHRFVSS